MLLTCTQAVAALVNTVCSSESFLPYSAILTFTGLIAKIITFKYGSDMVTGTLTKVQDLTLNQPNQANTTDPIWTATGALSSGPFVDLYLGGPLPLFFRRTYQSLLSAKNRYLGFNWMSNFDSSLTVFGNQVVVALEGGGTTTFVLNGGTYQPASPARKPYQLVQTPGGSFQFMDPESELIYTYSSGVLVQILDRNGNTLTVANGQVTDGLGRTLTFTYNDQGLLAQVQDQSGRSVSFSRDSAQGNFFTVVDAAGKSTTYFYDFFDNFLQSTTLPRGNTPYTQAFNRLGQTVSQTDSEGNVTNLAYNMGGTPGTSSVTNPLGNTTSFLYPNLVDLGSFTDAAGKTASYTYDTFHRMLTATDRLGNTTTYTYDPASGNVASFTDALGHVWTFTYQAQVQGSFTFYNLTQITYPDGTKETFTYDAAGNVLKVTDRAGKVTTYTYNSQGLVLTETNAAGGVTTITYNSDGTTASVTLAGGAKDVYSYDNLKRLSKITHSDGTSISLTYDALDRIVSTTDERGNVTQYVYDANGNLVSSTDALHGTASATYDTDDLTSTTADELGDTTHIQYDPLGAQTAEVNPAGEKTTFAYDKLERLQAVADPAGKGANYARNAEGDLTQATDALGNVWSFQVNANGLRTQTNSPLKESTTVTYDSMNRVSSVTDALGRVATTTYESRGLPATLTGPGTTALTWGSLPLLQSAADPNGNAWTIARDGEGRITTVADPLGRMVSSAYDSRDRLSSLTSSIDSEQITYDARGNLTQAQFSDSTTLSYTYDADNRVTAGPGFALTYDAAHRLTGSNGLMIAYDAAGRIVSITYAPGKTVTYAYESRGLLQKVTDWNGGSVTFTFDAAHRLTTLARSNGVTTLYTYDADGRMTGMTETKGNTTLSSIQLTLDAIGRVTAANRSVPQEAVFAVGGPLAFTYDAAEQISGDTYDARGRLTRDAAGGAYHWNAASRLLSYNRPDGTASFTYDGLGQRISRTGAAAVNYVLNYATGLPSVAVARSGGADVTYYIYAPDGGLLYSIDAASGARHFYSFDQTGSTIFLTGDTGTISDTYGISAYGEVVTAGASDSTNNPFTWQGQWGVMQEPGTSLYYVRFRYYDSTQGRFLSPDPVPSPAPREMNPYQYAAGDPTGNGDPMGLKTGKLVYGGAVNALGTKDPPEDFMDIMLKAHQNWLVAEWGRQREAAIRRIYGSAPKR